MAILRLILAAILLVTGCSSCSSTTTYVQGIPNLVQVRSGLYRSGQPISLDSWKYLYNLGVRHVVKLNFESEGSDSGALAVGMVVYPLAIQPQGDIDYFDAVLKSFVKPDEATLAQAEQIIESHDGVLVHCTHGQDRTGEVIGRERVLFEHWSKDLAYQEMLERGFHPLLRGLKESWDEFQP